MSEVPVVEIWPCTFEHSKSQDFQETRIYQWEFTNHSAPRSAMYFDLRICIHGILKKMEWLLNVAQ